MSESCEICRFFKPVDGDRGKCRKRAPGTFQEGSNQSLAVLPLVNMDFWCGDYYPADVPTPLQLLTDTAVEFYGDDYRKGELASDRRARFIDLAKVVGSDVAARTCHFEDQEFKKRMDRAGH